MPGRVAFVPPRFGPRVVGGSEAVMAETARGVAARGWDVEIVTTCAVNHYTWENELPPGAREEEDGLLVRRFPTTTYHSRLMSRVQMAVQSGRPVTLEEQLGWISSRFTVPDLFQHLLRYGPGYDAVVFSPYLFWTATVCLPLVAERAVVIPCLHDETYARLDVVRPVLGDPASVWFLSEPEHQLAHELGPVAAHHRVTGAGVGVPASYDPAAFVARHRLPRPFVLFAGRREADKGWDWLLDTYRAAVARGGIDLDLVTIGVGDVTIPPDLAGRVIDLGFLPESERDDAVAAAAAYLQPSRMESFSRSVMEAWLAGTPVLAIDTGAVVAWHCERSGGGLTFGTADELATALRWIAASPEQAAAMAARGREYVLAEYTWPVVLDRMEEDLEAVASRLGPLVTLTLVAGTYPPIPRPAAAATIDAVKREWERGHDVVVVSPRPSAAHLTVPFAGPFASRRLDNVRRQSGATRLVFCVERGLPFDPDTGSLWAWWVRRWSAGRLAEALGRFEHSTLVVTDRDLQLGPLRGAANEIVEDIRPGVQPAGITLFGPVEVRWQDRAAHRGGQLARLVLGRRWGPVRAALAKARRRVRSFARP